MELLKAVTGQPDATAPSYCVDKPDKHVYTAEVLTVLEVDENPYGGDAMIFVCFHVRHRGHRQDLRYQL
jgi:hypothetical protein